MVEIEITAKAAKTAINETDHLVKEATSDNQQDVSEQAVHEMERDAKMTLSMVNRALSGWGHNGTGSSSKEKDHSEEVDI